MGHVELEETRAGAIRLGNRLDGGGVGDGEGIGEVEFVGDFCDGDLAEGVVRFCLCLWGRNPWERRLGNCVSDGVREGKDRGTFVPEDGGAAVLDVGVDKLPGYGTVPEELLRGSRGECMTVQRWS